MRNVWIISLILGIIAAGIWIVRPVPADAPNEKPNAVKTPSSAPTSRPASQPATGFSFKPSSDPAQDIADLIGMARRLVMKRSPLAIDIYLALSDAYLRQYRQDGKIHPKSLLQAQAAALMAVRFAPERADARLTLAKTLEAGGLKKEAVRQLQMALLLDAKHAEAKAMLTRLGGKPHKMQRFHAPATP